MRNTVPLVDITRQHQDVWADLDRAYRRVLENSGFILGEEVERFEEEFAAYTGVRHCVGVASGTAALSLALAAAGVGTGDEVVVPGHTFVATALAVAHLGATPVACDVDPQTGLIDPAAAAAAITDRTVGIVAVHLYGQVADMAALRRMTDAAGIMLLEDAAQAHGADGEGGRAGSLGTASAFSFYPSKNLGALGDGGAVCTDDGELAERVRQLRHLGQRGKNEHVLLGFNERLDGLQAAFLRVKLRRLDAWNDARRAVARRYDRELRGSALRPLEVRPGNCWHLYPVRSTHRDHARASLADADISTGIHYPHALHEHPALEGVLRAADGLEASVSWTREVLSLPMFEGLTEPEIDRVVEGCAGLSTTALDAAGANHR